MEQDHRGSVPHEMNRLTIPVPDPFPEFRSRFEEAVPRFRGDRYARLVTEGASWDAVADATRDDAPHGFLLYWGMDVSQLFSLAGHRLPAMEYLMGNHLLAERMYRHDPAALLYAPLRVLIYADAAGTKFTIDRPGTVFAGFGHAEITEVGAELDDELAALLRHLRAPVPAELTSARAA